LRMVPRVIIISVLTLILSISLFGCSKKTNSDVQITSDNLEGKIVVTIVDKSTKKPISDVKIIIMGNNDTYKTDDKGLSPDISLKISKNAYKKYGENLTRKAPAGVVTVLALKEGYKDYVIFNKSVYPGYASNRLNIELSKLAKSDKQKFTVDVEQPHEMWIQELISYCESVKDEKSGTGENKLTINVKDQKSKAIEGASVVIPELGIKGITDKAGNVALKPELGKEVTESYPVKKDFQEYTVVVMKEGYMHGVRFDAAVYNGKDNSVSIKLKPVSSTGAKGFVSESQPFDSIWVQKLIDNYKNEL